MKPIPVSKYVSRQPLSPETVARFLEVAKANAEYMTAQRILYELSYREDRTRAEEDELKRVGRFVTNFRSRFLREAAQPYSGMEQLRQAAEKELR